MKNKEYIFLNRLGSGELKDFRSNQLSNFYEYTPQDVDQMFLTPRSCYFRDLLEYLKNTPTDSFIKFYKTNNDGRERFFVNSSHSDLFDNFEYQYADIEPFEVFDSLDGGVHLRGSIADFGTSLVSLVRIENLPLKKVYECHLDSFSDEYVVIGKRVDDSLAEKKIDTSLNENSEAGASSISNIRNRKAAKEAYQRLDEITDGDVCHFLVSVWLIVKSTDESDLRSKVKSICKDLKKTDHKFVVEKNGLFNVLQEITPGLKPKHQYAKELDNLYLSRLMPTHRDQIHTKGVPFSTADGREQEVYIDFFDKKNSNYNYLCTGESGNGKSYLANHITYYLKAQFQDNITIGIYDLGGSLFKTSSYLGGVRFDARINPFMIKDVEFIRDFIIAVVGSEEFDKKAKGELYEIIKENLNFSDSFRSLLEKIDESLTTVENLSFYFNEFWDYFTDEIIEVPKVFYVDLFHIPNNLFPAYILFVRKLSQLKYERIANIYDEMWYYLDMVPELLMEDSKTARKKLEANFYFTQQINELFMGDNKASDAIIGNTFGKIYFNQPYINAPILTDEEKEMMSSVISKKDEYSEFYIKTNNYKKVLRLYPEPLIYELSQSERDELVHQYDFLEKAQELYPFRDAFNIYVRSKYAH